MVFIGSKMIGREDDDMLAEERFAAILSLLNDKKSVTVLALTQALQISESTIRRDLITLHKMGKLKKVHGGATLLHKDYGLYEMDMVARGNEHQEEKKKIGEYAASLIQEHDFIYIDAGSTTLQFVEYIQEKDAIYVTNGLEHGKRLAKSGYRVFLLAGEIKETIEAVVGLGAVSSLQKYNFTKAFFGTNGIRIDRGFTTPDMNEAYVKSEAMKRSQKAYVLADSSKFGTCTSISVADISDATIITVKGIDELYHKEADIIEVLL